MPDLINGLGNIQEYSPHFQQLRVLKSLMNFIYKIRVDLWWNHHVEIQIGFE